MTYGEVWAIAEVEQGQLKGVSFELLSWGQALAQKLNSPLCSILIGGEVSQDMMQELIHRGADKVYVVNHPSLHDFVVERHSKVLAHLIESIQPHTVLAAATSRGRTLMPHVAIKVDTGLTADCTELDIEAETGCLLQTRPAVGGNIIATIKTPNHMPQMATVRPKSSRPLTPNKERTGDIIYPPLPISADWFDTRVEVLGFRRVEGDNTNIQEADVVIAGGKGLKKGDNFDMLKVLCQQLGAVLGATRDAVDRGWMTYPHQIGLSGKTISPRVYIAVGVSGAVQHLAGIKTAETIIVINEDADAHIMKLADLSIVGDLFVILPRLQQRLAQWEKDGDIRNV